MISKEEEEIFPSIILPEIEFSVEPTQVGRGQTVTLQWHVQDAEEATLFTSTILPKNPEHLNWLRIKELGEKVELNDSLESTIEETTVFYLVAQSQQGLRGAKAVVEVAEKEPELEREPVIWEPQEQFLDRTEDLGGIEWFEETIQPTPADIVAQVELALKQFEWWFAGTNPPIINISINPEVIFTDETAILNWRVSNAQYTSSSSTMSRTYLVADPTKASGNRLDGGGYGSGGSPWGTAMSGSWKIEGARHQQQHLRQYVSARNALGKSAEASAWLDILSIPQFKGASTPQRQSFIRNALKSSDKKLRNGCIYNNAALDKTVAAFRDGRLNRQQFWWRLLIELQNLKLVTFNCQELRGTSQRVKDTASASFRDYSNEIILRWKVDLNLMPTSYAILHELIHKCGFNSDLLKYYSKASIETQAHLIAEACFP